MKKLAIQLLYFEQLKDCSVQREKCFDSTLDLYNFMNNYSFVNGLNAGTINDVRIEWEIQEMEG